MEENENKYGTECRCDKDKHICGLNCDARNCVYNDGKHQCCADQVNVGPSTADCSSDTVCATFKPKTY